MKPSITTGLIGAALVAAFQLLTMIGNFTGSLGGLLFYAPMLIYFASIYFSIKRTKNEQPDQILPFKTGLKAGGITALIICIVWGIAFFIGLTHQDPYMIASYMKANNQTGDIPKMLETFSDRQIMFDRTKFWAMPNFLLGFLIIVGSTVVLARRKR